MKNIFDKLTEEQAQIALEIVQKAREMGIDPRLAVTLAYQESGFNPAAKGSKGEVGLMQVMPATAESMGFKPEELANPSKNIEIGLTYLKRGLDKFGGDPVLAVAGYNAGLDHPYFSDPENKSLPDSTKDYIKSINSMGGFAPTPAAQEEAAPEAAEVVTPASEDDFNAQKLRIALDAGFMLGGAGASKLADMGRGVVGGAQDTIRAMRTLPGALSVLQSMQNAGAQPPSMPSAPAAPSAPPQAGGPRPVVGGPAGPVGGPAAPLQQMGGSATANYGRAFGLTDIEANRALDMTKNPGGVHDLTTQRAQALQKINQMGGGFVENPRYGGLMTPEQGVGGGPRASYVQTPGAPGGMSKLPPPQPVSSVPQAPPKPGALATMGQGVKSGAGAVLRSPVAMGALGGLSLAEGAQQFEQRYRENDIPGMFISGAGMVGGAMQMIPHPLTRAVGAGLSSASPLTMYLYDKLRTAESQEPTPEELQRASKPAFVFPSTR